MKKTIFTIIIFILTLSLYGQHEKSYHTHGVTDNKSFIKGGFGEFSYSKRDREKGELEAQHFVLRMGYLFNDKWYFFGKASVQHFNEFEIENLFVNYSIKHDLNLQAGLLALPIGYHNAHHTPDSYLGVHLPIMYQHIIPFEWNDASVGIKGEWENYKLTYQAYLTAGVKSFCNNEGALLNGSTGIRNGRQTGHFTSLLPTFVGCLDYEGIEHFRLGASLLAGQSDTENRTKLKGISTDSTTVLIGILTGDVVYQNFGLSLKGEIAYSHIEGSQKYNSHLGTTLAKGMLGGYVEIGYNLLQYVNIKQRLIPFVRYGFANTHFETEKNMNPNPAFNKQELNIGLNYFINHHILLKADYTTVKNKSGVEDNEFRVSCSFLW